MNGEHFDDEELMTYLDDPEHYVHRSELEHHIMQCDACCQKLREYDEMGKDMESVALWEFSEAIRRAEETPLPSVFDRIEEEDEVATAFLTPLVNSPAAFRRTDILALPFVYVAGAVRRLYVMARELREDRPEHALTLANAAIGVAKQLPTGRYPASVLDELRGNAWLERANALRYLSRFSEAFDALDIASGAFRKTRLAALSTALVQHVRSTILLELERFDEALRLARSNAMTFDVSGDEEHYLGAKMVEAGAFFYQHKYATALDLFLGIIPRTKKFGDPVLIARLYSNIADCYDGMGNRADASGYLAMALSLFEAVGRTTEQVRTRWTLGRLLVRAGELPQGIARLRQTRSEFYRLGMTSDAELATLDLVEALLLSGWHAEVPELCEQLVSNFTALGMTSNALTALAYLNETVAERRATPQLVRYIREYLPQAAERVFVPPPPADPQKDLSLS